MLRSKLLSGNRHLNECEIKDPAHVKLGDRGDHVKLIQQALIAIDDASIAPGELATSSYGPTTASAVLKYKTKRKIINAAYQSQPDNIVGKMTIKSLDEEMQKLEASVPDEVSGAELRPVFGRLT